MSQQPNTLICLGNYAAVVESEDQHGMELGVLIERLESCSREEMAALVLVMYEVERARNLHPKFAHDSVHAAAILCEEAGETARAAINHYYAKGSVHDIADEAIQTAAVAVRLVLELHSAGK